MKDQVDPKRFTGKAFTRRKTFSEFHRRLRHQDRSVDRRPDHENDAAWPAGGLVMVPHCSLLPVSTPQYGEEDTFEAAQRSLQETVLGMARLGAKTTGQGHLVWSEGMTAQGVKFLETWVSEKVPLLPFTDDGMVRALTLKLKAMPSPPG